jgi:hypothetical protein
MDTDADRIIVSILHVSRKSGALVTYDPARTAEAVRASCGHWERVERALVTPGLKDTPPWAAYEMKIFELGRAIDQLIRKLKCWRGNGPVLDAAVDVSREPRFGRGRQSFVAALGEHALGAYGGELAALLHDELLAGYAIKALTRNGSGGYGCQVRAAGVRGRPWVRMAARAYLERFAGERELPPSSSHLL